MMLVEFPHVIYNEKGISAIDFEIERMPISKAEKTRLAISFNSGGGLIGKLPKSDKLLLFTPKGIKVIKTKPNASNMLPNDWAKYATIIRDGHIKETIQSLVREMLMEDIITTLKKTINVIFRIDKTGHALERQNRLGVTTINDKEIIDVVNRGIAEISKLLIFNKLNLNEKFVLKDIKTNINIVGVIEKSKSQGLLDFVIVTVMKKSDFKAKSGTKLIILR